LDGDPPAKLRESASKGWLCRRGSLSPGLYARLYLSICQSVLSDREGGRDDRMLGQFQLPLQSRPFRAIAVQPAVTGARIAGSPIAVGEPGHPKTHNLAAVLARLAAIGREGERAPPGPLPPLHRAVAGAEDFRLDPPTLLATRPASIYPDRVSVRFTALVDGGARHSGLASAASGPEPSLARRRSTNTGTAALGTQARSWTRRVWFGT
jgi:hypothetical protein